MCCSSPLFPVGHFRTSILSADFFSAFPRPSKDRKAKWVLGKQIPFVGRLGWAVRGGNFQEKSNTKILAAPCGH